MVRAAVSGAIDYAGADPRNRQWRIKHRLLLSEVTRREDYELLTTAHRHWLALLSHGNLTEESFIDIKKRSNALLGDIQKTVFPWVTPVDPNAAETSAEEPKKDTMLSKDLSDMLERYKELNNETD
jgi:hypothetical protein